MVMQIDVIQNLELLIWISCMNFKHLSNIMLYFLIIESRNKGCHDHDLVWIEQVKIEIDQWFHGFKPNWNQGGKSVPITKLIVLVQFQTNLKIKKYILRNFLKKITWVWIRMRFYHPFSLMCSSRLYHNLMLKFFSIIFNCSSKVLILQSVIFFYTNYNKRNLTKLSLSYVKSTIKFFITSLTIKIKFSHE